MEHRHRHRPERSHRNIPPIPDADHPRQVRIVHVHVRPRRLNLVQQPLERLLQLGQRGFMEAREVCVAAYLLRDDVGDGGEPDVDRFRIGPEPLLRDHGGDGSLVISRSE